MPFEWVLLANLIWVESPSNRFPFSQCSARLTRLSAVSNANSNYFLTRLDILRVSLGKWMISYCRETGNTSIVTLYNTRNTSIVMLQYRKSSIVWIQYWMYQYRAFTILEYQNLWSIHKVGRTKREARWEEWEKGWENKFTNDKTRHVA
jgi:hypothetical protein